MTVHSGPGTLGYDNTEQIFKFGQMVWNAGTLTWERMTQPGGAGGGGGGPATIADGADVAQGTTTDAESAAGDGTVIALLKRLRTLLTAPLAVSGTFFQATQPISAAALPLPAGAVLDATLTGGTAKNIVRGGAKAATAAADVTSTASGANHQPLDMILYDEAGNVVDPRLIRALTAADVVTAQQGTPPWVITSNKTNNAAAPAADLIAALVAIVNEALPAYTEGRLGLEALDLRGVARVVGIPMASLGVYEVKWKTGTYAGLAAGTPLWSKRWGDATRFAILLRQRLMVHTTVAATAAGLTERELIVARSFTVSDTGGTSFLPATNSAKRRTSMGTTLLTDMRAGAPITAGTRTLDTNPITSVAGWSGLLSTGVVIGASGSSAVGAARSTEGGGAMVDMYNALTGQDYPQTFATNEGVVIRIGDAQPAGATQETRGATLWLEANKIF